MFEVVRLLAPVPALSGGLVGAGQGAAQHHGVGAHGDGLDDVTGGTHTAVGDHVDVASARFVHVVTPRGRDVGDGGGHRRVDAEGTARRRGGAAAEADKYAGRTGAHQVQGRGIAGRATDNHGDVQFVDELLEVQRFMFLRD